MGFDKKLPYSEIEIRADSEIGRRRTETLSLFFKFFRLTVERIFA